MSFLSSDLWEMVQVQGGCFVSGFVLAISWQLLYRYGVAFNVFHDKKRQILLNLICFVCSINSFISFGFSERKVSAVMINFQSIVTFLYVQFALVILNHNSAVRLSTLLKILKKDRQKLNYYCCALYILPFVVLAPLFMIIDQIRGTDKTINSSNINARLFYPLYVVLIIIVQVSATVTDVLVLYKANQVRDKLNEKMYHNRVTEATWSDLQNGYAAMWLIMLFDLAIKLGCVSGIPTIFDSMMTIWTVSLRSRLNLHYGLELHKIFPANNNTAVAVRSTCIESASVLGLSG